MSAGLPHLIDTHCHIQTEEFDADRDDVLARAQEAGVDTLIVVGGAGDLSTNDAAVRLAEAHENLDATVGMHPHDAKDVAVEDMDRLRGLAGHPKVVAIGETGLDFYYEHSPRQVQRDMFERFVALAVETRLPIVVHNRESDREVAETIRNRGGGSLEGVIHCFTSDTAAARTFLEPWLLPVVLGHRHLQECRGAAGCRPLGASGPAAHRDRLAVPGARSPARAAERARLRPVRGRDPGPGPGDRG